MNLEVFSEWTQRYAVATSQRVIYARSLRAVSSPTSMATPLTVERAHTS
jgi:uncharacterized protein (DUF2062 family)